MEIKSKYLNRFQNLPEHLIDGIVLGDLILVEKIEEPEEITKGGIIIQRVGKDPREMAMLGGSETSLFTVLATGQGYTDPDGDIIIDSLGFEVGNLVAIPNVTVQYFKHLPAFQDYSPLTIGVAKAGDVRLKFKNSQQFSEYFDFLNDSNKRA